MLPLGDNPPVLRTIDLPSRLVHPRLALAAVLAVGLFLRLLWLDVPDHASIYDEVYYVNAARIMLGEPAIEHYAGDRVGIDPNHEHPPLGKLLMAGAMRIFGDDGYGWRMVSVLAGMASILLVYGIVRSTGGDAWLGVLAAGVFSADNLVFVSSRAGILDMPLTALMLLAAWLALRRWLLLAGVACAVAALIKLTGVYALLAILLYLLVDAWSRRDLSRHLLAPAGRLMLAFAPVWLAGLWLLDMWVTPYRFPWEHLAYMIQHGFSLTHFIGSSDPSSAPWQWLVNDRQINYYTATAGAQGTTIFFRGAMNPIVVGAAPLAIAYSVWRYIDRHDRLSLWVATWIAATYLPWVFLALVAHRITYINYFLPTLAAVAVAIAQLLRQAGLPRSVMWAYLVLLGMGFVFYFPYRAIP